MTPTELRIAAGRLEIEAYKLRSMRQPIALDLDHLVEPVEADVLLLVIASAMHDRADQIAKAKS